MNRKQQTNPIKAIRDYCKHNCCLDDRKSWQDCNATDCKLHPFRMGKNPFRVISEKQKAILVANLKKRANGGQNKNDSPEPESIPA